MKKIIMILIILFSVTIYSQHSMLNPYNKGNYVKVIDRNNKFFGYIFEVVTENIFDDECGFKTKILTRPQDHNIKMLVLFKFREVRQCNFLGELIEKEGS